MEIRNDLELKTRDSHDTVIVLCKDVNIHRDFYSVLEGFIHDVSKSESCDWPIDRRINEPG